MLFIRSRNRIYDLKNYSQNAIVIYLQMTVINLDKTIKNCLQNGSLRPDGLIYFTMFNSLPNVKF